MRRVENLKHAPLLPCMPPATHTPYHACPDLPHMPPPPCTPPCTPPVMHAPPLWTEGMIHACKNITFPPTTVADGDKSSPSLLMSTGVHRVYHEMLDRFLSKTFTPAEKQELAMLT